MSLKESMIKLQNEFATLAEAKVGKVLYAVFAVLEYSESGPEEGSGSAGAVKYLTGICLDKDSAEGLILEDYAKCLSDIGFRPIKHPLQTTKTPDEYVVTVDGSREHICFSNTVTWTIVEISANSRLEDFEL